MVTFLKISGAGLALLVLLSLCVLDHLSQRCQGLGSIPLRMSLLKNPLSLDFSHGHDLFPFLIALVQSLDRVFVLALVRLLALLRIGLRIRVGFIHGH